MNKEFNCPVEATISLIGGKYKSVILFHLMGKTLRYSELHKKIPKATDKMLAQQLRELEKDGAKAVLLKGHDSQGREKQMAMTVFDGWETIRIVSSKDTNPDAENSLVIVAEASRNKLYAYEPFVFISQVLTRESFEEFTEDEIFSIQKISYTDPENCGGYGPVTLEMKDGRTMIVDYTEMEGNLQI